jgi:peptide/nickel transport system substrate-binding protein
MFRKIHRIGFIILFIILTANTAVSADLVIGTRAEPSIDPHFLYLATNLAYSAHIYGKLTWADENMQVIPDLAVSWKPLDNLTWEFKLRQGVKFHDGSEFTAEDVVFSLERIPKVPNNPNPYTGRIRSIDGWEVLDPYTIRITTKKPDPLLPANLTRAVVVSKKVAQGATTDDFTSGKAAIGTGPYKFVKFVPGSHLVLERYEDYWGEKPAWKQVTFKIISNDAARVAALLAGDVDMIDYVPPTEVAHLEKKENIEVFKRSSARVIYFSPDTSRDQSPFVTTTDGEPLDKNPLKDWRVRKAISTAINREAITSRVMEGLAVPAGQFVPEGLLGYNPDIKVDKYDLAGAKKLLAEAGYPDGFGLTIHGPNDRYVNDAKICEAVGQMLAKLGLAIKVDTMPKTIYFSRARPPKSEFSFGLIGWGNPSGEVTEGLTGCLHTYQKERGYGVYNFGLYSNPEADKVIEQAAMTVVKSEREKLLQKAQKITMEDLAVIPLHAQFTMVATRKGITYIPRADEQTRAMNARPSK